MVIATIALLVFIYAVVAYFDLVRRIVTAIAGRLPCKVITYNGEPVLRRYHLFELPGGMALVMHQFVRSDPDRGYHDHPWSFGASLILSGGYLERAIKKAWDPVGKPKSEVPLSEVWYHAGRFNIFNGDNYHRVFVPTDQEAWTLFLSGPRVKTWGFLKIRPDDGLYHYTSYSKTVTDPDGRWWTEPRYQPGYKSQK